MKKCLSLLFTLTLVLILAACGSTSKEENKDSATNETQKTEATTTIRSWGNKCTTC